MKQKGFGTNVERHYKAGDIRQKTSRVYRHLSLEAFVVRNSVCRWLSEDT